MAASDLGKGVEGKAQVFGKEVAAELILKSFYDALEMGVGTA